MNNYFRKWHIIIVFQYHCTITEQTIAGITYMDNFDFNTRYRNVYECDPFYWHPLHLPEHCAEMFETAIRSRISSRSPVRLYTDKEQEIYTLRHHDFELYIPEIDIREYIQNTPPPPRPLSPYEKLFKSLRRDVQENPSAPVIRSMPNLGMVAVYHQPVSKKSKNIIEKLTGAYARAAETPMLPGLTDSSDTYYGQMDIFKPWMNGDDNRGSIDKIYTSDDKSKHNKKIDINEMGKGFKEKEVDGGVITIIKQ